MVSDSGVMEILPGNLGWDRVFKSEGPLENIKKKVSGFLEFPENWDSYGAARISPDVAFFSINFIESVISAVTPVPQVVPLHNGGIQFEWHENRINFEIAICKPNSCEYWYHDFTTGTEDSGVMTNDFHRIELVIARLSSFAD